MQLPLILAVLLIVAPSWVLANAGGTKPPGIVEGPARIIDGDTIRIGNTRIRLHLYGGDKLVHGSGGISQLRAA